MSELKPLRYRIDRWLMLLIPARKDRIAYVDVRLLSRNLPVGA